MRLMRSKAMWVAAVVVCLAAVVAAQAPAPAAAPSNTLVVAGDVEKATTWSLEALRGLPRTTVTVEDEEGGKATYEGVLVGELLGRAGAPLGSLLRGDAVATYVVATARDGYRAVFSLAELDPGFTTSRILVADTVDGKPLFDYQGPLRIVAPGDTRGARSVRMLERLDVVRVPRSH